MNDDPPIPFHFTRTQLINLLLSVLVQYHAEAQAGTDEPERAAVAAIMARLADEPDPDWWR